MENLGLNGFENRFEGFDILKSMCDNTGNNKYNGFISDMIYNVQFDDKGRMEFLSSKEVDGVNYDSVCTLLSDSFLVAQVEKDSKHSLYQLYSWDVNDKLYTYVVFDNKKSLMECFETVKDKDTNLCKNDIFLTFTEMGISFDNIAQVLLNQSNPELASMFEDSYVDINESKKTY